MALISLILALVLEQWRPLVERRRVYAPLNRYAAWLEGRLDAGERHHGILAWALAVVPLVLLVWFVYGLLYDLHPLLALAFNVAVLYVTMGFRQESHYFSDIQEALREGRLEDARRVLHRWRGHDCAGLTTNEIVRLSIESALATAHRHVFGVIFWFIIFPGPIGAVLYRVALQLYHRWGRRLPTGSAAGVYEAEQSFEMASQRDDVTEDEVDHSVRRARFGQFSRTAFGLLDAVPARLTAVSFAIVGDFEDAVYCWRTQAARWADRLSGIVIAAGGGAMGVKLGAPVSSAGLIEDRPEMGLGETADVAALDSTIGLIWRALVLWLAVLLVLSIATGVS